MAGIGGVPIVDWEGLMAQFQGREASVLKIAATVLYSQVGVPAQLRDLAARRDYPALARLAHSIKGMGGSIMAQRVFELGKQVDEAARLQSEAASGLAEELACVMEALLAEMGAHIQMDGS